MDGGEVAILLGQRGPRRPGAEGWSQDDLSLWLLSCSGKHLCIFMLNLLVSRVQRARGSILKDDPEQKDCGSDCPMGDSEESRLS